MTWLNLRKKKTCFKIREKIFYSMIITGLMVSLVLIAVMLKASTEVIRKNVVSSTEKYLDELSQNLEYRTRSFLSSTYTFMSNRDVLSILQAANENELDESSYRQNRKKIREVGRVQLNLIGEVYGYYMQDNHLQAYWDVQYTTTINNQTITEDEVEKILEYGKRQLQDKEMDTVWYYMEEYDRAFCVRRIYDPKQIRKKLGIIVFEVTNDFFGIGSHGYYTDDQNLIVLRNKKSGNCFTDGTVWEDVCGEEFIPQEEVDIGGNRYFCFSCPVNRENWEVYGLVLNSNFIRDAYDLIEIILVIGASVFLISVLVSRYVSASMTQNLEYLAENMQQVAGGNLSARTDINSSDEIGFLATQFNSMAEQIGQLIQNAYNSGVEKQKLKMQVLKAQINPHFLYNTLGSIRSMAIIRNEKDIADMTTALIDILRGSLSKKSEFHTVEDEVQSIKNYFLLQSYRYDDVFTVKYEISQDVNSWLMIDFVLQPLVENALFHGLDLLKDDGEIIVRAYEKTQKLILEVEDNGKGMTDEKMQEILRVHDTVYEGLRSIGVSNVHGRIQQYFGEQYGLVYEQSSTGGTLVKIYLPVLKKMEEAIKYAEDIDCRR